MKESIIPTEGGIVQKSSGAYGGLGELIKNEELEAGDLELLYEATLDALKNRSYRDKIENLVELEKSDSRYALAVVLRTLQPKEWEKVHELAQDIQLDHRLSIQATEDLDVLTRDILRFNKEGLSARILSKKEDQAYQILSHFKKILESESKTVPKEDAEPTDTMEHQNGWNDPTGLTGDRP